jgi:hypothetical protein
MVFSFIHPASCGFARGVAWENSKKLDEEWKFGDIDSRSQQKQSCKIEARFNRFNTVFESCKENFAIDLKGFRKIFPDLRKKFAGWNQRKIHERNQYTATFNIESWKRLSVAQKGQHTFENCRACQDRFLAVQTIFPEKSTRFIGNTHREVPSLTNDAIDACIAEQTSSTKRSRRQAAESARSVYNRINPSFESVWDMSLSAALVNVRELNIEAKKSKNEKRKERRSLYKKSKQATEAEWAKTDIVR